MIVSKSPVIMGEPVQASPLIQAALSVTRDQVIKPDETIELLDQNNGLISARIHFSVSEEAIIIRQRVISKSDEKAAPLLVHYEASDSVRKIKGTLKRIIPITHGEHADSKEYIWSDLIGDVLPGDKFSFYHNEDLLQSICIAEVGSRKSET